MAVHEGTAVFVGEGSLRASTISRQRLTARFAGSGALSAEVRNRRQAITAVLSGQGVLRTNPTITERWGWTFEGEGTLAFALSTNYSQMLFNVREELVFSAEIHPWETLDT